ncbi:polysaccharide pyruvyl transferase family protein [Puniceicoccus vermicola]|uniref:Polysaccharide pyruvyl transferase family protein n=1 Tax=Puniceicoccus vermicola TaxID=388746 RepID=A0A7X1E6F9_9BACT|nr:polysaccharide pyruvyl transferase family protein [Puniceicoccus vermicola]
MKHVLLHSGWQTTNIGDVGHTPGTLRFIEQHIPEASVSVLLHDWSESVLAMLRQRFPRITFIPREGKDYRPMKEHVSAFEKADLVIQNSGMLYNRFFQPDLRLMQMCIEARKPFGLYGQSFDGFPNDQKTEVVELFNHASFIYCRDTLSLQFLRSCEVKPRRLAFGPDGCFGTDLRNEEGANELLQKLHLKAGEYLTVTLRTNSPNKGKAENILNPAHLSAELIAENDRWADQLRAVIIGWVLNTGRPVLLAPEVEKEVEMARTYLFDPLPHAIQSHVVGPETFWDLDTAASIYAKARAMVAMEPHSCILGIGAHTPSIHYYTPKHGQKAEMFADIGLHPWLLDIEEVQPDRVLDTLSKIDQDPESARQSARQAMEYVEKTTAVNMQWIRKVLGLTN